jgi:hypothetical protein
VAVILPAQTTVAPSRIEKPDQIAKLSTGNDRLVYMGTKSWRGQWCDVDGLDAQREVTGSALRD